MKPLEDLVFVAIDVETTGLDPRQDAIIEVGAIAFQLDGKKLRTFQRFVDPRRKIPEFVTNLTGIAPEHVRGAPTLEQVVAELEAFIGDAVIVGQNVEFDLAHLQNGGFHTDVTAIDTAFLARALLRDRVPSRTLVELAAHFGISPNGAHRALADATTAAEVFLCLLREAWQLDDRLRLQWAELLALDQPVLAQLVAGPNTTLRPTLAGWRSLLAPSPPAPPPLRPTDALAPVSADELELAFAAAARVFQDFEDRPEQRAMAETVRHALAHGGRYLIEAGTGVGKSLAYLLPAAMFALRNQRRVLVSTHTLSLQDQLLHNDVPLVRRILVESGIIDREDALRVAVLKGRSNYLCLRRWRARAATIVSDPDAATLAAYVLPWLAQTLTGDRSELRLDREAHAIWTSVSAHDADCLRRQAREVREGTCFLERARRAAEGSHIVIVNHALLLADALHAGSAVPSHDILIIDEAHNLEDVATQQFGATASRRAMLEALDALSRPASRGRLSGGVAALLQQSAVEPLAEAGHRLASAVASARERIEPLVSAVARIASREADGRVLLSRAVRSSPEWADTEAAWFAFDASLRAVEVAGDEAVRVLGATAPPRADDLLADELLSALAGVRSLREALERIVSGDRNDITWAERDRDGNGVLRLAPLAPGPLVAAALFEGRHAVVATSATLFPGDDVGYALRAMGLDDAETLRLGSPLDYEKAALLATVTDLPEPGLAGYPDAVADAIVQLANASQGRALVLFTSHDALRAVRERVVGPLQEHGLAVLGQDVDGSPRQLIEYLRAHPQTVLLGTASFWQGVDIRGEALSLLVIARLPFAIPTDPIVLARSELFENPFEEYALPTAVLRFRQGFGRLIRHRDDRGVVVVLDRRITQRRYGRAFLDALPRCYRVHGTLETVVQATRRWLQR